MAIYYDMAAGFESEEDAKAFNDYFTALKITLSNGDMVPLKCSYSLVEDMWCAAVYPVGMSINSPQGSNTLLLKQPYTKEIEDFIYAALKTAPPFYFAMFGGESVEAVFHDEFYKDLIADRDWTFAGLVISKALWEELDHDPKYVEFRPGYGWTGAPGLYQN